MNGFIRFQGWGKHCENAKRGSPETREINQNFHEVIKRTIIGYLF